LLHFLPAHDALCMYVLKLERMQWHQVCSRAVPDRRHRMFHLPFALVTKWSRSTS
jgi:hypothetical protein